MTLFGVDVSNHQSDNGFDGDRAKREGFAFITHKINEGTWVDPFWARERDETWPVFPGRFGGYVFCRTNTHPADELFVTYTAARNDDGRLPPLQIDYEDTQNDGSIEDLWARVTEAQRLGFDLLPIYLPRWYWQSHMGSPDLSDLPVGIWNSDYVSGRGFASQLYPGDAHKGWADMGGKRVDILQFSETADAAGEYPCDVNAFRGTESDLDALFSAGKEAPMSDAQDVVDQLLGPDRQGHHILGRAEETAPERDRFLVEAIAVILTQLAGGPGYEGWPQLGEGADAAAARKASANAPRRTIVDGVAAVFERLAAVEAKLDQLIGGAK